MIPKRPKIGLVIGTYGALPYNHLFLESAKRNFNHIPILVVDDNSNQKYLLASLCSKYKVSFRTNKHRRGHLPGDAAVFTSGLTWAKKKHFDILVKMSRRFIPLYDWTKYLSSLAYVKQAFTYSNQDHSEHLPLRSECIAMHVPSWSIEKGAIWRVVNRALRVENQINDIVKSIRQKRSKVISLDGDYVVWKEVGNNRKVFQELILWHHHSKPERYFEKAREFGLEYQMKGFNPNNYT